MSRLPRSLDRSLRLPHSYLRSIADTCGGVRAKVEPHFIISNDLRGRSGPKWSYTDGHGESLAEGEGFEPPVPFQAQRFSRPPVSTAHPSLRGWAPLRLYFEMVVFCCNQFTGATNPPHHSQLGCRRSKGSHSFPGTMISCQMLQRSACSNASSLEPSLGRVSLSV